LRLITQIDFTDLGYNYGGKYKMNNYFKISMFISSFLPLWITILFIDTLSIIRNNKNLLTEIISIVTILLINLLSLFIIKTSIKSIGNTDYTNYTIKNAELEKSITSEFLLSYTLPLFAFDFTKWDNIIQFLIYFIILAFLCIRNNNVYANLLLECKKYKFYSCKMVWSSEPNTDPITGSVLSKENLTSQINNKIRIAPLSKPFYFMK